MTQIYFSIFKKESIVEKQRNKKGRRHIKTNTKMADINPILSMFTLNASWLNAPFEGKILAERGKKHYPIIHYLEEKHFRFKERNRMKVKRQKNIYYAKGNKKGVAIFNR